MKKSELQLMIREIVREELALSIKEVVNELRQPTNSTKPIQPADKKHYSKNKVINDVLNETATGGDWKTMGGSKFTSERMNDLVGGQYADMMQDSSTPNVNLAASMGVNPNEAPDFLTKDYRGLMKAVNEKSKQKQGQ